MTLLALCHQLRVDGISLTVHADGLHFRTSGTPLTDSIRDALSQHKPNLLELLQLSASDLQALADRCGRQMLHLDAHAHQMDGAEHERCCSAAGRNVSRLHAALLLRGEILDVYGWTQAPGAIWHRVGEQPVPPVLSAARAVLQRFAEHMHREGLSFPHELVSEAQLNALHQALNANDAAATERLTGIILGLARGAQSTLALGTADEDPFESVVLMGVPA